MRIGMNGLQTEHVKFMHKSGKHYKFNQYKTPLILSTAGFELMVFDVILNDANHSAISPSMFG